MLQRRWWLLSMVFYAFAVPAFGQTVTIEWVHNHSGQPLSQAYEFSPVRLRATDGGSAGLGSLSVRVTSDLRGDEEWITLWEDANNPGVFISNFYGLYVHGTLTTDPPAQDGLFQVTENAGPPLQRDTIRAFFESCSAPPCPTDAVPMIGSTIRLADSAWVDVDHAVPGGSLYIEVKDYGAPYWAPVTATVVSQSGDSETVSLPPDFSDPYDTLNVFRQSIDVELGPAVPGDGVLQVQDLDTITASHPDPLGLSSSTDSAVVDTRPVRFLDRFGNPAEYQFEDSPVRVRAVHPDGNTDPGAADAVTATLLTKDIEGNTRDTETLQLTETGPDTGVFTGQIQHMTYYQAYPGNGWLESWYTYSGPGAPSFSDLVTAVLDSESTTVPFLFSKVWFIDAAGNEATQYNLGGRIYMRVEREWANSSPVQADFLQVEVRSLTTGDFEYKTLHETGPDTAFFEGWIDSAELPAAWDNVLAVQAGETIEMIHQGYLIQVKDQAVIIINQPPVAGDDTASLAEDTAVSIPVLANDSDPENAPLYLDGIQTAPAHGTAAMEPSGSILYTPAQNYYGTDSFQYRVHDGIDSVVGAVTITISPVPDPPVAVDDFVTTPEDTPITVNALANDTDADGDALTISSYMPGACGTVMLNPDNTFTYTPEPNCYTPPGTPGYIMYWVSDGTSQDIGHVHLTVTPVNDPPVAVDDSSITAEDTAVAINVLANDSDLDGDTLVVSAVTQGTKGSVTFTASSVTYTPTANANGSDSFTYTASDGNGGSATATVAVSISAVNDAPDAVNDAAATNEDAAVTISVLANDADVDGEAVILTGVTQGTRGSVAQNGNGTVTYTPNPNTFGADSFTYTVRDAAGLTDTATVTVSVAPVNDPPDAINDSATANEGGSVAIVVLANDTDLEGNALTVTAASTPAHGTATINGNGTITYTPAPNYTGSDSFTYTISDGAATDTATVSVQVKEALGNVAVLGTHGVWIQSGADVLSGDVVANNAGSAPFLNGSVELSIGGGGASTAAGWDVQGNRVTVASGASVASDVHYNQLGGAVGGAQYTPLSLPVFATLPAFQSASPGSTDVNVAVNGSLTLAPGSYRDLNVGRKATVTFTGGTYHFRSIQVDREAKLFFSAASGIRVQQKMSTGITVTIGPGSGSSATAASIVFYVGGINGTSGTLAATPKAVEVGSDNVVSANIYAPNGTLWLKDHVQATGSFLGRDVNIGGSGQISLMSAW